MMPVARVFLILSPILLLILLGACAGRTPPPADDGLYRALGGEAGITRIAEEFIIGLSEDPRVGHHFADTDIGRFREKLIEHLCHESGGGCEYTGDSMAEVHRGMDISRAEFNITVEILQDAMDRAHVPVPAQNRLLARLAPLYGDIVERR